MASQKIINFQSPNFKQRATLFLLWLMLAVGLYCVRAVILPFILATLLAYVLHPLVRLLGKIKIKARPLPKALSVVLIYLFVAAITVVVCIIFIPQFYLEMVRLAKDASAFINSIDENAISTLGQKMEEFFRRYQIPVEVVAPVDGKAPVQHRSNWLSIDLLEIYRNLLNDILFYLKSQAKEIIASAQHVFTELVSILVMILLILMITVFILADVERIKAFLFSLVPVRDRASFDAFLERLDRRLSGVVRGQLTICLVNAVLTLIGLLILQVKFAIILATIAGIFSIVPIFGSILSTIPIVLVALTVSPMTALFALLWIGAIHALEANILNPKIMGDSAKIHPALILLALLAGEHFYGIIGALLAVPIMSIIITVFTTMLSRARQMEEGVANPVKDDTLPS